MFALLNSKLALASRRCGRDLLYLSVVEGVPVQEISVLTLDDILVRGISLYYLLLYSSRKLIVARL